MWNLRNRSQSVDRWLYLIWLGLLGILLAGCTFSIPITGSDELSPSSSGFIQQTFEYRGQQVDYDIFVPPNYRRGWPLPLVISIGDPDSNAAEQEKITALASGAGSRGYLIVYLRSTEGGSRWRYGDSNEPEDDVDFFMALVRQLSIAWDVAPGRLYIVGMGQGAEFGYVIGCTFADQVTAVALVAGQYPVDLACQPSRALSVLMIHGTQDAEMPFGAQAPYRPVQEAAQTWAAWNGCGLPSATTYTNKNVQVEGWSGCQDGTEVILFSIMGTGHIWPGGPTDSGNSSGAELNATELIWQFFATHTR